MTHGRRKLLAILVLVLGLPIYIVLATTVLGLFERPSVLVELLIYVALGVAWALPLRGLFRGLAREEPAKEE